MKILPAEVLNLTLKELLYLNKNISKYDVLDRDFLVRLIGDSKGLPNVEEIVNFEFNYDDEENLVDETEAFNIIKEF